MQLIQNHLHDWNPALPTIQLKVPRSMLAKRRWRAAAEDGVEFGFDLESRLGDGDAIHQSDSAVYFIEQLSEPVLELPLPAEPGAGARLGWMVGNLHFQIEVVPGAIRLVDDPALRQLCERERLAFTACERVFHPLSGGHSHAPSEPQA